MSSSWEYTESWWHEDGRKCWIEIETGVHVQEMQPLLPHDWPLQFNLDWCKACCELDLTCGEFAMGWEL